MHKKHSAMFRIAAFILVFVLICPVNSYAVEPRASYYLDSYSAYIYPAGWGKVQVWFIVDGVETMDEIGTLKIWLYESTDGETWNQAKLFQYMDYSDMLTYNDYTHSGHVEYAGTIGRYYKAYVCVWAGQDGEGDSRYFWTSPVKATLFAG